MVKQQLISACHRLLGPIVRILLRSGVPWEEFAELSKQVYVEIARRDYGIQGRPTNLARVAMMTGLSRREVGRLRKVLEEGDEQPAPPAEDRLSRILTGWHLDPDFIDGDGRPKELPARGQSGSLEALFRRYGGDMPHGALRKELTQLGLMESGNKMFRVLARDYVRAPQDPAIIRQMGIALHDHGATLAHNVNQDRTTPARFEGMATNPLVNRRYSRAFSELVEARGHEFLEEIDAWLSKHEVKATPATKTARRMGVGVYLIYDDKPQEADQ